MSIKYYDKSGTTPQEILLAGISPVDQILNGTSKNAIANKAVYNALKEKIEKTVSDLVNYYSKSDIYNKAEVRALISTISTMDIQVVNALPTEDISTTTIYFLKPAGATTYDEYVYINNAWVKIGTTDLDLSQYVTNDALTLRLADYYTKAEIATLLTDYVQKDNVYDKDEVDALLDDKQNTLTFDNVPTENSTNVVKSGGVYSTVDDVYKVMGENGAKNLLPYPFYGESTKTSNGITFTDNGDGTVTANGTATADADFYPFFANVGTRKLVTLPAGKYTISGCPSGGSSTSYYIYISLWNEAHTGGVAKGFDYGEGFELILDEETELRGFVVRIVNGHTVSNLTFKPMIRLALDTDLTYQPYAETNYQLTQNKMSYADNGILGAKNLLHYPYVQTTQTKYGVTFTDNGDGTLTIGGTQDGSSNRPYYGCGQWWQTDKTASNYFLKSGSSIIASISTSNDNIGIRVFAFNTSGSAVHDKAVYGSQELTVGPFSTDVYVAVCIETKANSSTIDNVTIYPMLRLASDTDNTWQPYAKSNRELTEDQYINVANGITVEFTQNFTTSYIWTVPNDGWYTLKLQNNAADTGYALTIGLSPYDNETANYIINVIRTVGQAYDFVYATLPLKKNTKIIYKYGNSSIQCQASAIRLYTNS